MPIQPGTYATSAPVTAHQLNQDLYTYDGSYFGANGVAFHSNRPMLLESLNKVQPVNVTITGGFTTVGGTAAEAISVLDNAALYGTGSDGPGDSAKFSSTGAIAPGSAGAPGQYGGWNLISTFIPVKYPNGAATPVVGAAWSIGGSIMPNVGALVAGLTTGENVPFAVDLVNRVGSGPGASAIFQPAVYNQDVSGPYNSTVVTNTITTYGKSATFTEVWCGVNEGGATVSTIPVPMTQITTALTLTAATLNTSIRRTFNLLNYPPMLSCTVSSSATVPANTVTIVPFTSPPVLDNYAGYSTLSTTYTIAQPGLYFAHANVIYNTVFTTGSAVAGFQVNGTNYFGGAYNGIPISSLGQQTNAGASVTKMLDLQAGDTLKVVTRTTTGTSFGHSAIGRFLLVWMANQNGQGNLPWQPPDVTGFQFAAATAPDGILNANPYFAGGSGTGWTGFDGTFTVSGSPPAGAPYANAGFFTISTSGAGATARESSGAFSIGQNRIFVLSTWVNTPQASVTVGFDWLDTNKQLISSSTQVISVQENAWAQVVTDPVFCAPGARFAYPRIAPADGVGNSIYFTGAEVTADRPSLVSLLQTRLANDINFLLNRPYLTVHQTFAQTGLGTASAAADNWKTITMQSTVGLVHATLGDNYNGWNAAGNYYQAPVDGWYFAVAEYAMALGTGTTSDLAVAGFSVPVSGGFTAPSVSRGGPPDQYQRTPVASAGTAPSGATAIGAYYLSAGERITPVAEYVAASGGPSTWGTDSTHQFVSHFSLVWMSN